MVSGFRNKVIIALITVSLLAQPIFFLIPQKAEATLPAIVVGDLADIIKEIADAIVNVILKAMVRKVVDKLVNWINTGFEGNPFYVSDLQGYFEEAVGEGKAVFLSRLSDVGMNDILCTDFSADLTYILEQQPTFDDKIKCSLQDAITNVQGYMNDFNQGGWEGWLSMATNQQNNPYGAYLIAQNEIATEQENKKEEKKTDVVAGGGNLGMRVCADPPTGGTGTDPCKQWQVVTPGQMINDRMASAMGTDIDQLNMADEWNEIVAALVNQLLGKVFEGIKSNKVAGRTDPAKPAPYLTDETIKSWKDDFDILKDKVDTLMADGENTYLNLFYRGVTKYYFAFVSYLAIKECEDQFNYFKELYEARDGMEKAVKYYTDFDGWVNNILVLKKDMNDFEERMAIANKNDNEFGDADLGDLQNRYNSLYKVIGTDMTQMVDMGKMMVNTIKDNLKKDDDEIYGDKFNGGNNAGVVRSRIDCYGKASLYLRKINKEKIIEAENSICPSDPQKRSLLPALCSLGSFTAVKPGMLQIIKTRAFMATKMGGFLVAEGKFGENVFDEIKKLLSQLPGVDPNIGNANLTFNYPAKLTGNPVTQPGPEAGGCILTGTTCNYNFIFNHYQNCDGENIVDCGTMTCQSQNNPLSDTAQCVAPFGTGGDFCSGTSKQTCDSFECRGHWLPFEVPMCTKEIGPLYSCVTCPSCQYQIKKDSQGNYVCYLP